MAFRLTACAELRAASLPPMLESLEGWAEK